MFGIPLEEILKRPQHNIDGIPSIVKKSIDYITQNEEVLKTEGLFRVSSSTTALESFNEAIDEGILKYETKIDFSRKRS